MSRSEPNSEESGRPAGAPVDQGEGVVLRVSRKQALARSVRLPRVSGKASVLSLVICFVLSAALVFIVGRRLPAWVRWEIVVGGWWLVWAFALGRLLYLGQQLSDDHVLGAPRNWLAGDADSKKKQKSRSSSWGWDLGSWDFPSGDFGEGCLIAIAVIAALVVALFGFWFLIEVAIPGLAFVTYFLIRGMLARVVNDDHGCAQDWLRAARWGLVWATVYTVPLALLVWIAHLIAAQQVTS